MIPAIHIIALSLVAVCGLMAVVFRDLLSSVIALAAMSLILSLEFYLLQAPDVAIAEAAIAAALTTAIFVLAIRKTVREEEEK
ncbi:MAG: hydrogenase subunit MbhD domain-containing protein [Candidatus Bipolaricaulota bacterium]